MKSLFRITTLFVALLLLVPVAGAAAKKRGRSLTLGERTLKQGDTGRDVKSLQKLLSRTGLKTPADGEFGKGTTANVKAFEQSQRRPVDGKVTRTDAMIITDVARNGGAVVAAQATGGALPKKLAPPKPPPPPTPPPLQIGPGFVATINPDGTATAPAMAPLPIQAMINAGNQIATKPYIYGGGHGKWDDAGYDCSGSVSYALHGAGLLETAMPSGSFETWGDAGPGQWVTLYANGGHIYAVIAGLRFDTSGRSGAGTRWQSDMRSGKGYVVRHPTGL